MNQPDTAPPSGPPAYPSELFLKTLLRWYIRWYIGLIIRPSPTIREIVERRPPLWFGLGSLYLGIFVSFVCFLSGITLADGGIDSTGLEVDVATAIILGPSAIIGYCAAAPILLALWVLVMHLIGRRLERAGSYSTSLVTMSLASTVAFCAFGLVIIGFGLFYFNRGGLWSD